MENNSVPKFIFRLSRFPVYRGSVLGRFYCINNVFGCIYRYLWPYQHNGNDSPESRSCRSNKETTSHEGTINRSPPHVATAPSGARASSLPRNHDHTQARHTRQNSSVRLISPKQRPLPDNTQYSKKETDGHAPGRIRTSNPSKRTVADPRLRPRGHYNKPYNFYSNKREVV